ncbi:MAG: ATP-binding protein [Candidatus Omnitrophica bacterium]|jgi:two-component system phosphate regulon sensor histidine kinase PhoR|nr:ATP-binding protein [Candidatus Omnitrophota bacterium]MDD5525958.1 ATP-binding protein [Candidatus Omnitrophota bacterium]
MKIRLHWKLTAFFFCVFIFTFFAGYLYLSGQVKAFLRENFYSEIKSQLFINKAVLESSLSGKMPVDLQDTAGVIGKALSLRVSVIGMDGRLLGDSGLTPELLLAADNHAGRPEVADALRNGFGTSRRFSHTLRRQMLYMAAPFGKGEVSGVLRFSVPERQAASLGRRGVNVAGAGLILILFSSLFITFVTSVYVSRPLVSISRTAELMAKGDLSRKALVNSGDEIGDLAASLNSLAEEIKGRIDGISSEKAKLDAVLASMFEGLVVTDEQEKVVLMNPSLRRLFSVKEDPQGSKLIEVLRNIAVQEMADKIILEKERLVTGEIRVFVPEEKVLRVNGVPIIRRGRLEGAVMVFHDITELRRLEKVRQDFVANVSHELRTPLSSIKGYAETLLDGAVEDKGHAREFIGIIHQESDRLANLINDLLDLARIESGNMELSKAPFDVLAVAKRAVESMGGQARAKSIKLGITAFSGVLPLAVGDEFGFRQVLTNLLDNALKYTPEGGGVTISVEAAGGFLQVNVADTGIGISPADIPRIFERFYRVDKARSREAGGTGLGLSIVKHIVQAHGGRVWVESAPGSGSVFSFTIPSA